MSKSRANEFLQELCDRLNKNWQGKKRLTSTEAYKMCEKIVEESKNEPCDAEKNR